VRRRAVSLASVLLAGCISTAQQPYDAEAQPPTGMGRVYIVSPDTPCANWGFFGTTVFINEKEAFSLKENTYSKVDLPPGPYKFTTSTDRQAFCHDGARSNWSPVLVEVTSGTTSFLKYGSHIHIPGYCLGTCERHLMVIDKSIAEEQLSGTDYVEPR
jgi:hypothetical protein